MTNMDAPREDSGEFVFYFGSNQIVTLDKLKSESSPLRLTISDAGIYHFAAKDCPDEKQPLVTYERPDSVLTRGLTEQDLMHDLHYLTCKELGIVVPTAELNFTRYDLKTSPEEILCLQNLVRFARSEELPFYMLENDNEDILVGGYGSRKLIKGQGSLEELHSMFE